jgi:hypothetical protein
MSNLSSSALQQCMDNERLIQRVLFIRKFYLAQIHEVRSMIQQTRQHRQRLLQTVKSQGYTNDNYSTLQKLEQHVAEVRQPTAQSKK